MFLIRFVDVEAGHAVYEMLQCVRMKGGLDVRHAGLIGWVPNCDTLHTLIRDYRESRKVPLNVEHRLMLGMAPDYDQLSVIQKVEVFEHALDSTSGAFPALQAFPFSPPHGSQVGQCKFKSRRHHRGELQWQARGCV